MKRFLSFAFSAFVVMGIASCTKNDIPDSPVPDGDHVPFELVADAAQVKSTIDEDWNASWENGDIIYAVTQDGEWNADLSETDLKIYNPNFFTYSDGVFSTTSTISDGEHVFKFMHVDKGGVKDYFLGSQAAECALPSIQEQDCTDPRANIGKYDVSAAKATVNTPTGSIGVTMTHLYTFMEVTLKNKTSEEINVETFNIKVDGAELAGSFDVYFNSEPEIILPRNANNYDEITVVLENGTIPPSGELPVYVVMAPVTEYSGNVTFTATTTGGSFFTKTNAVSDLTFAAGTYNTASFSLKEMVAPVIADGAYFMANAGETCFAAEYYHEGSQALAGIGIWIDESGNVKTVDSENNIYDLAMTVEVVPTGKFAGLYTIRDKNGKYLCPEYDSSRGQYINVTDHPEDRSYWHIDENVDGSHNIYSPWFSKGNFRRLWCQQSFSYSATFTCSYLSFDSNIKFIPFTIRPQIVLEESSLEADRYGELHTAYFHINNPVVGEEVSVTPSADWLYVYGLGSQFFSLKIDPNEGAERSCTVTLSYKGAEDVTYNIHQAGSI